MSCNAFMLMRCSIYIYATYASISCATLFGIMQAKCVNQSMDFGHTFHNTCCGLRGWVLGCTLDPHLNKKKKGSIPFRVACAPKIKSANIMSSMTSVDVFPYTKAEQICTQQLLFVYLGKGLSVLHGHRTQMNHLWSLQIQADDDEKG